VPQLALPPLPASTTKPSSPGVPSPSPTAVAPGWNLGEEAPSRLLASTLAAGRAGDHRDDVLHGVRLELRKLLVRDDRSVLESTAPSSVFEQRRSYARLPALRRAPERRLLCSAQESCAETS
jgi:hypothetical protein